MAKLLAALKGMVTAPGQLVRDPESCVQADNVLFDLAGVVRKRWGWVRQSTALGGPVWGLYSGPDTNTIFSGNNVLIQMGTATATAGLKYGDGISGPTSLTTIDGQPVTSASQSTHPGASFAMGTACAYLGNTRTRRIESAADGVRYAGMPYGLPLGTASSLTGAAGFLQNTWNVAYRVTWHRKAGSLNAVLGGPPTGRYVFRNAAGGNRNTSCRILLPKEFGTSATALTTSYFYRLWRSRSSSVEPDDEMFLVAEAFLVAADIAAGYVDVADATVDTVLASAPPLHTNTNFISLADTNTTQGPLNADEAPPLQCLALAQWNDVMWYGNGLSSIGDISNTLLSNMADGDNITVDSTTYTAKAAPGALPQFQLGATIELTCLALCDAINRYATNTENWAFYVSQGTQLAGAIRFIARRNVAVQLSSTTGGTRWRNQLSASPISSDGGVGGGLLRYSKPGRPDAVAPQNLLTLDSSSSIIALVPFRQRLLVFTNTGIWQVTGDNYASFSLTPFDLTYRLLGPRLWALCDDKVYAWCSEGVVEIDAGGATIISHPVETTVRDIVTAETFASMYFAGFALGYRLKHQVMFFYPSGFNATTNAQCSYWLNFDTRTRAWSRGYFNTTGSPDGRSCGVVRYADDRGVLADWVATSTDCYLYPEAKDDTYSDTLRNNSSAAIVSTVAMQFQIPNPAGAVLLRDIWLHWWRRDGRDGAAADWRPATVSITESTGLDSATETVSTTLSGSDNVTRRLVGKAARRGSRYAVTLTHSTIDEKFGLSGVALDFIDDGAKGRVAS